MKEKDIDILCKIEEELKRIDEEILFIRKVEADLNRSIVEKTQNESFYHRLTTTIQSILICCFVSLILILIRNYFIDSYASIAISVGYFCYIVFTICVTCYNVGLGVCAFIGCFIYDATLGKIISELSYVILHDLEFFIIIAILLIAVTGLMKDNRSIDENQLEYTKAKESVLLKRQSRLNKLREQILNKEKEL